MKRLLLCLLVLSIISCKASISNKENESEEKFGIELSLDFSNSRSVYYQKEEVDSLEIKIIKENEDVYKTLSTDLENNALTINIEEIGNYKLEVIAYNADRNVIATGTSGYFYLTYGMGYYKLKVWLNPEKKTLDFDTEIIWATPYDDGENHYLYISVDDNIIKKINVYNGYVNKDSLLPIKIGDYFITELYSDSELTQKIDFIEYNNFYLYDFSEISTVYATLVDKEKIISDFFEQWKLYGTCYLDDEGNRVYESLEYDYNYVYSSYFVATAGFEGFSLVCNQEETSIYYGISENEIEVPERGWTDWFELESIRRVNNDKNGGCISGLKKGSRYKYLIEYKPETKKVYGMIALQEEAADDPFDLTDGWGVILAPLNSYTPEDFYNKTLEYNSEKDLYLLNYVSNYSKLGMILNDGANMYNAKHKYMYTSFTLGETNEFIEMKKSVEDYISIDDPNVICNLTPDTEYTFLFRIKDNYNVEYFVIESENLSSFLEEYEP